MPSILTNAAAEGANANINIHSRNAAASVGKLSSGSRIVRPADDAASLAISNKLKSNIATLTQAKVNAGQTSSLLQIAGGGVTRVSEILTRLKTLSTQSVNGTLSDSERLISQEEFGQLVKQIDNTVNQTQLNGIKLLAGKANATFDESANISSASIRGTVDPDTATSGTSTFRGTTLAYGGVTGLVQGTADDVRTTTDGSELLIEIDIKNGTSVETFSGRLTAGATDASVVRFKSTTNDLNSFTLTTEDSSNSTADATGAAEVTSNLKAILGINASTGGNVVFQSANIAESVNAFRSDIQVFSNYKSSGTDGEFPTGATPSTVPANADLTFAVTKNGTTTTFTDVILNLGANATLNTIVSAVNAETATTGVAAVAKDVNGDGDLNLVLYAIDPDATLAVSDGTTTGAVAALGLAVDSTTAGSYSDVISATSTTPAGTYTLTSVHSSETDDTTFRLQDQSGNVYESTMADVSLLSDDATKNQVSFSNGVTLTFTNDNLRRTSSDSAVNGGVQVQFGKSGYETRFEIEKSGNVSVGLDSFNDLLTVALDSVSTEALKITDASGANLISIDTAGKAQAAQVVIDKAIDTLNKNTAKIGALQSRFSQIDTNLTTVIENSNAANGQFVDVDFAAESSNFYKNQALLQAAVGVAAQANQMPQQLLRLVG
jgi:flagellin